MSHRSIRRLHLDLQHAHRMAVFILSWCKDHDLVYFGDPSRMQPSCMYMYLHVHVYIYIYIYIHIYVFVYYLYIFVYNCIHMCTCTFMRMYIYIQIHMYIYIERERGRGAFICSFICTHTGTLLCLVLHSRGTCFVAMRLLKLSAWQHVQAHLHPHGSDDSCSLCQRLQVLTTRSTCPKP